MLAIPVAIEPPPAAGHGGGKVPPAMEEWRGHLLHLIFPSSGKESPGSPTAALRQGGRVRSPRSTRKLRASDGDSRCPAMEIRVVPNRGALSRRWSSVAAGDGDSHRRVYRPGGVTARVERLLGDTLLRPSFHRDADGNRTKKTKKNEPVSHYRWQVSKFFFSQKQLKVGEAALSFVLE